MVYSDLLRKMRSSPRIGASAGPSIGNAIIHTSDGVGVISRITSRLKQIEHEYSLPSLIREGQFVRLRCTISIGGRSYEERTGTHFHCRLSAR
jgi:hypothetical protein